jgi:hypothetical protein
VSEEFGNSGDSTRLCPTCRTAISVLATRCRFCGESVGRPRREEHKLTVNDLGGESRSNYTISGNVMDALESFRAEEISSAEAHRQSKQKSSWFGKKNGGDPTRGHFADDMPELDASNQDFITPTRAYSSRSVPVKRRADSAPQIIKALGMAAVIITALVLLYVVGGAAWKGASAWLAARNQPEVVDYNSQASEMLAAGRPVVEAYLEGLDAVKRRDKPENREELDQVRQKFVEEVESVLNAHKFSRARLDEISRWMSRVELKETTPAIAQLKDRVDREVAAYRMILTDIQVAGNAAESKATFKLHNHYVTPDVQTVSEGDWVQERFVVQKIFPTSVRLQDQEADGRVITCKIKSTISDG